MDYRLVVTRPAENDLDEILTYIRIELGNPIAASDFLGEVEKCYEALIYTPLMYELCNDFVLKFQGYRRAIIKRYVMIYRVDETTKTIYIMRFFHSTRDYLKLI